MSQNQSLDISPAAEAAAVTPTTTGDDRLAGSRLILLLSALVAGALIWLLLHGTYPMFSIPEELVAQTIGSLGTLPPALAAAIEEAYRMMNLKHAVVVFGIFGAVLASLLAVGGGIARRSLATVLAGIVLGVVVGGGVGSLAGYLGFVVEDIVKPNEEVSTLIRNVSVQGVILMVLGAGVGLTFGLLTRRLPAALSCLAYGLVGGGLVAMIFPLAVALAVPNLEPEATIPSHETVRFVWIMLVSGTLGLLIPEALRPRVPRGRATRSAAA
ncbi:MAG: hypothetical protein ACYC6N_08855 [Pirellulaceae bacterium]